MTRELTPSEVEFLKRPLPAQLVTLNPSGSPLLTVMWFLYEDGGMLFSTTLDRHKFRNQQADARASALVLDPADDFQWIRMDGTLSVDDRDPMELYRRVAASYLTVEGMEWWSANVPVGRRTVLRLAPRTIRSRGFDETGFTIPPSYRRRR